MVCSAEISRINGAKSRGAVTKRGRAIASRNATKHGLLAQMPPLLVTEDLTTFEGFIGSLIDYYQPENPVEHFLIQQVAMGMLKQYRLWNVEAAIANIEILKLQQQASFPDVVTAPQANLDSLNECTDKRTPLKEILGKEKRILQKLISALDFDLSHLQENSETETLDGLRESLGRNYYHANQKEEVYQHQDRFEQWLNNSWDESKQVYNADFQEAIVHANQLIELAKQRLAEIQPILKEMETSARVIQQAETASKGMQQQEVFSRYQREIDRNLYATLDKLEEMKQQRIHRNSIGSFGQTKPD